MRASNKKPRPEPNFLFEVRFEGKTVLSTRYPQCVPDKRKRVSMRKAGYTLFLNGKPFKASNMPQ